MPEHGTISRYKHHKCGCDLCLAAWRDYGRRYRRQRAYGRWEPLTDADPVREHVRSLQAASLGLRRIAELSGIPQPTLSKLLYGRPAQGKEPTQRVLQATAAALFAVKPDADLIAGAVPVDATGTRRRLQALVAVGWSVPTLAKLSGISVVTIRYCLNGNDSHARTVRVVKALYDRMWDQKPPEENRHQKASAVKARNYAAKHGWPPPMAWDDEAIDDPDASPAGAGGDLSEWGQKLPSAGEVAWLHDEIGESKELIAQRFGAKPDSVRQALLRAKAAA